MGNGWEKRLNSTVKMMLQKKTLVHMAGHMGTFRLSKAMAMKEEKRLHRQAQMKVRQQFRVVDRQLWHPAEALLT
jgi:hypothetical protein